MRSCICQSNSREEAAKVFLAPDIVWPTSQVQNQSQLTFGRCHTVAHGALPGLVTRILQANRNTSYQAGDDSNEILNSKSGKEIYGYVIAEKQNIGSRGGDTLRISNFYFSWI